MSGDDAEIRDLQKALYGRDGTVTREGLDRLASLRSPRETVSAPACVDEAEEELENPVTSHSDEEGGRAVCPPTVATGSSGSSRNAWLLSAGGVGLLGLGVVAGLALEANEPTQPIAHAVPPSIGMLKEDTVVYFGEVGESRVWSAVDLEGRRCVLAAAPPPTNGGDMVCKSDASTVALSVPSGRTGLAMEYAVSFDPEGRALPTLTVTRG
ncbi:MULTISPECIES: hypothetical protein [unclassified Microbacterium]|uniref:hypothetical protein n=1 Tax=unclassified Microbacterium TaxID=2609290 RepID=UPI0021A3C3CA|nr:MULTISPECIES: hypothetical protein [unclassified Microbacterium]MCT1364033.1 hypothetical protein [Microbacterium sp. p3-SID131]MCT1375325.1 hypothetical protein [Microbacterium sp. p3-SID337]